jgi:hypothetical protein
MIRSSSPRASHPRGLPRPVRLAVILPLLLQASCTSDGYPLDNTYHYQGRAPTAAPQPSTFAYRYPDTPPVLNVAGLQDFVGRYRHRVVLLGFWASWSRQAREELMMLTRLQQSLEAEGFQVIACNVDAPGQWRSSTVPILHASKANFPCVVVPESARPGLRAWLAPNWNYALPARFVINRSGQVAMQAMTETPIENVEAQVRNLVAGGGLGDAEAGLSANAAALRTRLIDVRNGTATPLPEFTANPADARRLAAQLVAILTTRLDRTANPRIALLPFGSSRDRRYVSPLGKDTARAVEAGLREKGFYDLISASRSERMVEDAGLSPVALEYDSTLAKGKLACDYLLIGWIRGDVERGGVPGGMSVRREPDRSADE